MARKRNNARPINRLTPTDRQTVRANVQRFLTYIQRRRMLTELSTLAQEADAIDDELEFDLTAPIIKGHHKSVAI